MILFYATIYKMDEKKLTNWLREQTYCYWSNKLDKDKIKKLEALPLWDWKYYLPYTLKNKSNTYIKNWFKHN